MKRKHLVWQLEALETFERPKLDLEQYATSVTMAVEILHSINNEDGLEGKVIGDFGCGPGILMIGAALMGAKKCKGYDIDSDVVQICQRNIEEAEVEGLCTVEVKDVLVDFKLLPEDAFDLIVMNPPFGTKNNEGTDLRFVCAAIELLKADGSVYSLHKTSTREGVLKKASAWTNIKMTVMAELRWELLKTYKHQRKETVDIAVDLIRFQKC